MKAEIISVGTELTTGKNLDTNSQWLSRRLAEIGIPTAFHTTVGDDLAANVEVLQAATRRVQLCVITGGLGPTLDDLTREALACVAGAQLVFDQPSFDAIAAMFAARNRPMPERNRVQAMIPAGGVAIPNTLGTAPGVWLAVNGCSVVALPGVPREMRVMFDDWVRPRLAGLGRGVLVERRLNTFGAGESHVESLLGDLTARGRDPEVGITASDATISLRIVTVASTAEVAAARIAPVEQIARERLGELVYGIADDELEDIVVRQMIERGLTVATAESITAGGVAARLARVAGASACLKGGVVAYTNEVKSTVLRVPAELLSEFGAVSRPVAEAMAVGVRRLLGADFGISTTGLAGPSDGGEGKPVGLAYLGCAWAGGVESLDLRWFGSRIEIQGRVAKSALNMLRRKLSAVK